MSTSTIAPAAAPPVPAAASRPKRAVRVPYRAVSWAVPVLLLCGWELLSRTGVIASTVLPAPSSVGVTAWHLTETGELPRHLWESLKRAAVGLALGGGTGLVLGVLTGFSRLFDALIDRTVQIVRAVPFLAILPLVMVWFGVGES